MTHSKEFLRKNILADSSAFYYKIDASTAKDLDKVVDNWHDEENHNNDAR